MLIKIITAAVFIKFAYQNKKKRNFYLFAAAFILLFSTLRTFVYQKIYGEEAQFFEAQKKFSAEISPIRNKQKITFERGKYSIVYEPQAKINLYAKIAYIYRNDTMFSSFDYYSNPVYDTISPIDLSVFIGSMAEDWKKYKVTHERRAMFVYGGIKVGEWENIHIIPANNNIRRGFDTVKRGDNILLKGFLINWQGTGAYDYLNMKTALSFETISEEKLAGRITWLCMQFLVTELTANGYTFM